MRVLFFMPPSCNPRGSQASNPWGVRQIVWTREVKRGKGAGLLISSRKEGVRGALDGWRTINEVRGDADIGEFRVCDHEQLARGEFRAAIEYTSGRDGGLRGDQGCGLGAWDIHWGLDREEACKALLCAPLPEEHVPDVRLSDHAEIYVCRVEGAVPIRHIYCNRLAMKSVIELQIICRASVSSKHLTTGRTRFISGVHPASFLIEVECKVWARAGMHLIRCR